MSKEDTKKQIITSYLNTINLGSNTLGVKVAARRYFNKEVSDLTLSECAVLASITKNPSRLNPITGAEANAERRAIVLQYMYEQKKITKAQQEEALADDVYSQHPERGRGKQRERQSLQLFHGRADRAGDTGPDGKAGLYGEPGQQPALLRWPADLHDPGPGHPGHCGRGDQQPGQL